MNNKEIIYLLLNLQFSPFSGTLFIYIYINLLIKMII